MHICTKVYRKQELSNKEVNKIGGCCLNKLNDKIWRVKYEKTEFIKELLGDEWENGKGEL